MKKKVLLSALPFLCLSALAAGSSLISLSGLALVVALAAAPSLAVVFLILLVLFLLNYLAQFWPPLGKVVFLSPLHYHRPVEVLVSGVWPWRDLGVLTCAGGLLWLAGGIVFARRDLCTV